MGRPRTSEAERSFRRARILTSATELLAKQGFHGVTMEALAEAAGCSAATLYTYFDGKEGLFAAVVDRLENEVLALLEAARPEGLSVRQALHWIVQRLSEFADRNQALIATYLGQCTAPANLGEVHERVHAAFVRTYRGIFAAGQASGEIRDDLDAGDLAVAFEGMASAVAVAQLAAGKPFLQTDIWTINLILDGARR